MCRTPMSAFTAYDWLCPLIRLGARHRAWVRYAQLYTVRTYALLGSCCSFGQGFLPLFALSQNPARHPHRHHRTYIHSVLSERRTQVLRGIIPRPLADSDCVRLRGRRVQETDDRVLSDWPNLQYIQGHSIDFATARIPCVHPQRSDPSQAPYS
ncbi:hypothetical protein BV20DRAFT_38127 [Pilatotrama ljubarskyi]|nr:hypothetical protein BV20DRAFT_38127 [Pilatotrama ljubarskyi]